MNCHVDPDRDIIGIVKITARVNDNRTGEGELMTFYRLRDDPDIVVSRLRDELIRYGFSINELSAAVACGSQCNNKYVCANLKELFEAENEQE